MDEKKQDAPEIGEPKVEGLDEIEKEIKRPRPKKKAKRRAGRPTLDEQKAKEAEEAELEETESRIMVSALAGGFGVLCELVAAPRWGSWWNLKDQEKQALGEVWAVPVNRWLPSFFKNHPDEAKALMVTFGIFAPRWEKTRQVIEEMKRKQAEAEAGKGYKSPDLPRDNLAKEQEAHNKEAEKQ